MKITQVKKTPTPMGSLTSNSASSKIKISFFNQQTGDRMYFKVNIKTKIHTFLRNYCKESELEYGEVTFLHDGKRIPPNATIEQAELEDEDEIDVMVHCGGGGPSK